MLSKSKIYEEIHKGTIVVTPFRHEYLNPNSYDLSLGDNIAVYSGEVLDTKSYNDVINSRIPEDGMTLLPGELYLAHTQEYTETHGFVPILEGKSSLARLGLGIHVTAGFGDIGFKGQWVLEMTVVKPTIIYPGMRIGQISYHEVTGTLEDKYSGKYQNQMGARSSESHKDFK